MNIFTAIFYMQWKAQCFLSANLFQSAIVGLYVTTTVMMTHHLEMWIPHTKTDEEKLHQVINENVCVGVCVCIELALFSLSMEKASYLHNGKSFSLLYGNVKIAWRIHNTHNKM